MDFFTACRLQVTETDTSRELSFVIEVTENRDPKLKFERLSLVLALLKLPHPVSMVAVRSGQSISSERGAAEVTPSPARASS